MEERIHKLKTWPEYFIEVKRGRKPFEVRKMDRDFRVGDILVLEEYYIGSNIYSGDTVSGKVTYILKGGAFGVEEGYCVMGVKWSK